MSQRPGLETLPVLYYPADVSGLGEVLYCFAQFFAVESKVSSSIIL
jgi:hypothetical protein